MPSSKGNFLFLIILVLLTLTPLSRAQTEHPDNPDDCKRMGGYWHEQMNHCMFFDKTHNVNLSYNFSPSFAKTTGQRGFSNELVPGMAMVDYNWIQSKRARFFVDFMGTLEPATFTATDGIHKGFPLATQIGDGRLDAQHEHPWFMGLSFQEVLSLKGDGSWHLSVGCGPRMNASWGPTAFMHRRSSGMGPNMVAPMGHHRQDAGHLASSNCMIGIDTPRYSFECSYFSGHDPELDKVGFDLHSPDSWGCKGTRRVKNANFGAWYAQVKETHWPDNQLEDPVEHSRYLGGWFSNRKKFSNGISYDNTVIGGWVHSREDKVWLGSALEEIVIRFFQSRLNMYTRFEAYQRTPRELGLTPELAGPPDSVAAMQFIDTQMRPWVYFQMGGGEVQVKKLEWGSTKVYLGGFGGHIWLPHEYQAFYGSASKAGQSSANPWLYGVNLRFEGNRLFSFGKDVESK